MTKLEIAKSRRLIVGLEVLIASLEGFRRFTRDLAMRRSIYR